MNNAMLLSRRRIMMKQKSGKAPSADMVLLMNSPNTGDFSVATNYGEFTAVKVPDYPYLGTTVTHKLSISNVTFSEGRSLLRTSTLVVGVESWGTSNTYTSTQSLFYACTKLRGIPSSWEGLANVTTAKSMFSGCASLTSIPSSWEGLDSLTTADSMIRNCTSLTSIPASWEGLDNVADTNSMFYGCTSLTSIPSSWEGLGSLADAYRMFRDCTSLTSIPSSWEGLWSLNATHNMFRDCTSLTNCGTTFTGLDKVINVMSLFDGCTAMQGDIHALYVYLYTKPIVVHYKQYCFRNCTQAAGYDLIPASWK